MKTLNYNLSGGDYILLPDEQAYGQSIDFQFTYSDIVGSPKIEVYKKNDIGMPYVFVDSLDINPEGISDYIKVTGCTYEYFQFKLVANGATGVINAINLTKA